MQPKITGLEAATSHGNHIEEKLLKKNLTVTERIQQSLNLLETYFHEKRFDYLERILNDLHSDLHHFGKKDIERLLSFILQFFNMKYEDSIDLDYLYRVVMSVLQQMPETHDVEMFLHNNNEVISDRILDLNDPCLISELAVTHFRKNLPTILSTYLNKVIDQWDFLDANIDQRSFIRLFWITFNLGLDKPFINVLDESAAFLEGDLPEAKIFTVYQNPNLDPVSKKVEIEGLKRKLRYFDKEESKLIFPSLDKRLVKMIMKANTNKLRNESSQETSVPSSVRKMMYVVKLPNENPVFPGTKATLTHEWIQLAFFNDVFFNSPPKYVSVKVLSQNQTGKVYVTSSILQEIKSMIGRKKFIDVRSFEAKGNEAINNMSGNFHWPSTEIIGNGIIDSNENSLLNEVSDLKRIGYQITGLTREKRWLLLEKAVKQLGLKKVAYTIAQNVKLRKGQKNGERKFSYAISEWEYDLSKLKKHFYKNEFTWPSTKVKN